MKQRRRKREVEPTNYLTPYSWVPLQKPPVAATQEFLDIFWNLICLYRVQKSPPLVPILSQIIAVHTTSSYLCNIHFNIILPPKSRSSSFYVSFWFPTKILYAFFVFFFIRTTCPVHLILLNLIILIILREEYKLWSSLLWSFLQPPFTSSLFGPIISSAPCSQTPCLPSSLNVRVQVSHPYRTTTKL
jgi:hypothetical protein